jgi:hypothetical protein
VLGALVCTGGETNGAGAGAGAGEDTKGAPVYPAYYCGWVMKGAGACAGDTNGAGVG